MEHYYEVTKVKDGFYRIGSKENVFMELIVGSERALLFDTGYGFGDLARTVRSITDLPLVIVNSHGHLDHACGNFQFEEPIYIGEKDVEFCRKTNSREGREEAVAAGRHTFDYSSGQVIDILPEDFDEAAYLAGGEGNLVPVADGYVFDLGGIELTVVKLPGHTKGSIGLYCAKEKLLLCGDAVGKYLWLFEDQSTMLSEYIKTLKKIKAMDVTILRQAHNPFNVSATEVDTYIDCAEHVDYEHGVPFEASFSSIQAEEIRVCIRPGYSMEDMMRTPGFAAIVTTPEHID